MDHVSPAERAVSRFDAFIHVHEGHRARKEVLIEEPRLPTRAPCGEAGTLQITLSWTLSEGADAWAIYRTDYKTLPADVGHERCRAVAGAPADIVEFPGIHLSRAVTPSSGPARIIPFPGR